MTEPQEATHVHIQGPVPSIAVQCRSWFADARAAGPMAVFWVSLFAGFGLSFGIETGHEAARAVRFLRTLMLGPAP